MSAKISKLEKQYEEEFSEAASTTKLSNIFDKISIYINGYTDPTSEELKRIMLSHGGTYCHYFNPTSTTHIIASNLCGAKLKHLKGGEKIVKPSWIVDSIAEGKLLDYKNYLLCPDLVNKSQQKLNFQVKPVDGQGITIHPAIFEDEADSPIQHHDTIHNEGPSTEDLPNEMVSPKKTLGSTTTSEASTSKSPSKPLRAGEDNFLSEFYNRSRLHHLSTMGALFKQYVSELRAKSDGTLPGTTNTFFIYNL